MSRYNPQRPPAASVPVPRKWTKASGHAAYAAQWTVRHVAALIRSRSSDVTTRTAIRSKDSVPRATHTVR